MAAGSRITAAATTGPAQGPRPASSMPQTGRGAAISKLKSGGPVFVVWHLSRAFPRHEGGDPGRI